jgi:glycosyltransferase involved in cell wall biosynthesis
MNKKTILVVMPVYNSELTIADAIKSVLRQRYEDIHLVIVDDASTDKSLEIAKSFAHDHRVTIYQNKKNMGAYYSRNYGLYAFRDKSWGYFTTHDADDISFSNRYGTMIKVLNKRVNAVQDTFIRKNLKTRATINTELTMAHAVFTREVFDSIGYFDDTRFGGDWEHWHRLKIYNKMFSSKTTSISEAMGESYIHDSNLTVLIPIGSDARKDYIEKSYAAVSDMAKTKNFYRDFSPLSTTKQVSNGLRRPSRAPDLAPRVAVIVLTWKRKRAIKDILSSLSSQTYKDFTVYVSNGDERSSQVVDKYATFFREEHGLDIRVRHDGNEQLAFRRLTVARELAKAGTDIIFYIDDDIAIPPNYLEICLDQYEDKTYHSGFAWTLFNNGKNYYKDRERKWDNEYRLQYLGTGVSMIDAKIFLEDGLTNPKTVPQGAYKVEDLWLSYYADHILKWKLKYISMPGVTIGGADNVALYKKILSEEYTKQHFLLDLIKMGWKIPKKPIKA